MSEKNLWNKAWSAFYNNYKKTMILPVILLLVSSGILLNNYFTKGVFVELDLSLKGGVYFTITTSQEFQAPELESWISSELGTSSVDVRKLTNALTQEVQGYSFRVGETGIKRDSVEPLVEDKFGLQVNDSNFSFGVQGSELGESFFSDFVIIVTISFALMGVVIYYFFRKVAPSVSIMFSTFSDVVVVLSVLSVIGAKLSLGSLGAILTIIGYSSNSDVLLATHILKRRDAEAEQRVKRAFKTELTNEVVALIAFSIMYFLSNIPIIRQIALVLCIGVVSDLINTWFMGRGLLMSVAEKEGML